MVTRNRLVASMGTALAAFGVTGCMPSEYAYLNATPDMLETWLRECEGNDSDPLRRERNCTLAIRSPGISQDDLAFALSSRAYVYHGWGQFASSVADLSQAIGIDSDDDLLYENRGLSYVEMGQADLAVADFDRAYDLTGDRRYRALADNAEREVAMRQAESHARRRMALIYLGLWCGAVQRDSPLDAANEVRVDIVASSDEVQAQRLVRDYDNVTAGFRSTAGAGEVWRGRAVDYVTLEVHLWEDDDIGDDPMGATTRSFSPSLIVESGLRSENQFNYHIKTNHNQDGARCHTYHLLRDIEPVPLPVPPPPPR